VRYVQPLTDGQRELLEQTMHEDPSFRARSRAHSLLLSAAGMTIKAIAKPSQVHRVTVSAWRGIRLRRDTLWHQPVSAMA
jgi:hypothetical protein